jgi:tRNA pseudouridine38-40 synthase
MDLQRYFLELTYKGTGFSGFQTQKNAHTIQAEVERVLNILLESQVSRSAGAAMLVEDDENKTSRRASPDIPASGLGIDNRVMLTGSSRTDTGVHALQNYFHFDWPGEFKPEWVYNLNALLPAGIAVCEVQKVHRGAHCRFDAVSRTYRYRVYRSKNPFLTDTAYFYPYPLDLEQMNKASELLSGYADFTSFSKRKTQVRNFRCNIMDSHWREEGPLLIYEVTANRFLRGMVRGLTATMLRVGRGRISVDDLRGIIEARDCTRAWFDTPPHGLFLMEVAYGDGYFGR